MSVAAYQDMARPLVSVSSAEGGGGLEDAGAAGGSGLAGSSAERVFSTAMTFEQGLLAIARGVALSLAAWGIISWWAWRDDRVDEDDW